MSKYIPLLLLLCALSACGNDPLPKPDLLNHPTSEWPARTKAMSTEELFYVYRYNLTLKPPYDSSFADYLGLRGKEAVLLWIESLEKEQEPIIDQPYLFSPIIQQANYRGGYDLCADSETLNRAAAAMVRPGRARSIGESLPLIRESCVKA
jgi:hypothetical protein